ncbi:hypothetical protein FisN_10Lu363 [Fistulifera solaris]|jgi:hypothetical protein|uniref:SAM domain-containing protein n=1 Tax=Fistulifera solaris TaxID=1519565 RepID=A0A1Z5KFP2_FISSO|nr:hypothetical protein FisN_10Lu363 [Fistulifera solaris]|eukprot:GAX25134.1 hypothetical protein FisN_10Lu363 [Fistulifera solaris]
MPAPLHYFIPIASILITSFGLRFLPIPACMPRIAISSTSVHQDYHQRSSHGGNTGVLPEGSWYNWTAGQVQEWVQRCISADPEIAQAFHKHNIQGLDLPLLTVSDYQSIGLPLGVACHLKREFDKLQAKDKFIATDHGTGTSTTLGWLEQLNQQHSNSTNSTIALQFYDELKDEYGISVSADAVKTIFQERFGNTFTLPQLSSHQGLANIGVRQKGVFDTDKPPSSIRQSSKLPTDIPLVQNGLPTPKEFSGELPGLSSMPPHIRSIYERKPHLVNQFLAQKQRSCNEEQRALLSADNQEEGHTPEDEHGGIYHSIQ